MFLRLSGEKVKSSRYYVRSFRNILTFFLGEGGLTSDIPYTQVWGADFERALYTGFHSSLWVFFLFFLSSNFIRGFDRKLQRKKKHHLKLAKKVNSIYFKYCTKKGGGQKRQESGTKYVQ